MRKLTQLTTTAVIITEVLLYSGGFRHRHHGLLTDARVAGLVEGLDGDVEAGIFPDDLHGVLVSVEAVHQDQRDVGVVLLVEELDLLDGEVQEGEVVPHWDDGLWSAAAHAGAQAAIQLDHDQLLQHPLDALLVLRQRQLSVRSDLATRQVSLTGSLLVTPSYSQCSTHRIGWKFLNLIPLHGGPTGGDELPEQSFESVKVLLDLLPGSRGTRHHQLVQLHGQADLGVLLRQIFELHAW